MTKKVYNLIVGITGAVATAAIALVTYFDPAHSVAINTGIGIAETAVIEIVSLFVEKSDK